MNVVAVVGLGYVGHPLAVAFRKIMPTIGYGLRFKKSISAAMQKSTNVTWQQALVTRDAKERLHTLEAITVS